MKLPESNDISNQAVYQTVATSILLCKIQEEAEKGSTMEEEDSDWDIFIDKIKVVLNEKSPRVNEEVISSEHDPSRLVQMSLAKLAKQRGLAGATILCFMISAISLIAGVIVRLL